MGREFVFRLPNGPGAETTGAGEQNSSGNPDDKSLGRVLVVDDERDIAKIQAMVARRMGYEVEEAYDAQAALSMIDEFQPHIVLLDIGMPDMNGYEIAREIRSQKALARIKLVALTGYGQAEDRERAFEAGFDEHLVKPPTLDALRSVLEPAG